VSSKILNAIAWFFSLFFIDQLAKYFAVAPWLNTRLNIFLITLGVGTFFLLVYLGWRSSPYRLLTTHYSLLTLLAAGGASNLLDRLFFGGVRDVFTWGSLYFNLADVYVVGGLGLFVLTLLEISKSE
jgi:lipoprotein signal peptidase